MITRVRLAALLAVAILAALALAACGDDSSENGAGNAVDVAFIQGMTPHHESAIAMAKIARKRGQSEYVKQLADDIVDSQSGEIRVMEAIGHDLEGVKAADLGMSQKDMGMGMDDSMLETADPFDREFIDMMIPHHQGAIRMARMELAEGKSAALKNVAEDIVAAQAKEIRAMNEHRKAEFGSVSPAGGVPPEGESGSDGHDMGHM
jgi:uncharacterized protein (DUF305 family)